MLLGLLVAFLVIVRVEQRRYQRNVKHRNDVARLLEHAIIPAESEPIRRHTRAQPRIPNGDET